jgi:hypothetical protein
LYGLFSFFHFITFFWGRVCPPSDTTAPTLLFAGNQKVVANKGQVKGQDNKKKNNIIFNKLKN